MKKKIGILIVIIILLIVGLIAYQHVKPKKVENVNVGVVNKKYENMFNSFTRTIMLMDKYDKGQKVTKSKLSDNEKLEVIKSLIDENDYTESKEKADFNDSLAKTRTIKKATVLQKFKDVFEEDYELPDSLFIFPYNYQLEGDSYIGEAIIAGMESGPSWDYKAYAYSIKDDVLSIEGIAFYYDFDKYCSDIECNGVVDVEDYDHVLDKKESFTKIVVNFTKNNNKTYKFKSVQIGD